MPEPGHHQDTLVACQFAQRAFRSHAFMASRETPRSPVRRVLPWMIISRVPNNSGPARFWASSKKVESEHPVPSSRLMKTTRLPLSIRHAVKR